MFFSLFYLLFKVLYLFLVSVFRTLKLVKAQPFLGFTGGGRSALTGGAHSVRLLGRAFSFPLSVFRFQFSAFRFPFISLCHIRTPSNHLPPA